jgi:hypothetical protein
MRFVAAGLLAIALFIGKGQTTVAQKSLAVPEDVIFTTGVEYASPGKEHLHLNLARPKKGDGPFPAVLCIHGGGFRAGKRESYDGLCIRLAQKGYVAATVTYRLAPKHPFPAAVHDVKAAVRWLRTNAAKYHIDPDRIGVTRGLAGAHVNLERCKLVSQAIERSSSATQFPEVRPCRCPLSSRHCSTAGAKSPTKPAAALGMTKPACSSTWATMHSTFTGRSATPIPSKSA